MKKVISLIFFVSIAYTLYCQSFIKSGILEPVVAFDEKKLINNGNDGIILVLRSNNRTAPSPKNKIIKSEDPKGRSIFYYICVYDSQLELNYTLEVPFTLSNQSNSNPPYIINENILYDNGYLNITGKYEGEIMFCRIDLATKQIDQASKPAKKALVNSIKLSQYGSIIIFDIGFICVTNYKTVTEINNFADKKRKIFDVMIGEKSNSRYTIASEVNDGNQLSTLFIDRFDEGGNLTKSITLEDEKKEFYFY